MRLRCGGSGFFLGRAATMLFAQAVAARGLLAGFLAAQLVARLVTLELAATPQLVVRHAVALGPVRALATFDRALLGFGRLLRRFSHRLLSLDLRNAELYYTSPKSQSRVGSAFSREPVSPLRRAAALHPYRPVGLRTLPARRREV